MNNLDIIIPLIISVLLSAGLIVFAIRVAKEEDND